MITASPATPLTSISVCFLHMVMASTEAIRILPSTGQGLTSRHVATQLDQRGYLVTTVLPDPPRSARTAVTRHLEPLHRDHGSASLNPRCDGENPNAA